MQSPERCQREGRHGRGDPKHQYAQQVHERNIHSVQGEIHPMIAGRMRPIAEDGVIQQVGEGGERAIQAIGRAAVPILFSQNEPKVLRRHRLDAGILRNHHGVV